MTFQIYWHEFASHQAAEYLADDPTGLTAVYEAVDSMAENPRPAESYPWGKTHRHLHVGRYRVLYRIEDGKLFVEVIHLVRRS